MSKKNKKAANLGMILGLLGLVAGIFLMFGEDWITGVFGSIASAGVAYTGYKSSKEAQD